MVNTTHHGVVLGRDRKLRTDIDFAKGFTTVLKIPWLVALSANIVETSTTLGISVGRRMLTKS